MNSGAWIVCGALAGAIGVSLGAFGAHGLEQVIVQEQPADNVSVEDFSTLQTRRLENFETATRYLMYHAPALVLVGLITAQRRSTAAQLAGWCFLLGAVVFSGLLYAWVFTQIRTLAMIVPIGGTGYIAGWIALAFAARGITLPTRSAG